MFRNLSTISVLFNNLAEEYIWTLDREPARSLENGEYRAAFAPSFALFEDEVRKYMIKSGVIGKSDKMRISHLYKILSERMELNKNEQNKIRRWIDTRNSIMHTNELITHSKARKYTSEILEFIEILRRY